MPFSLILLSSHLRSENLKITAAKKSGGTFSFNHRENTIIFVLFLFISLFLRLSSLSFDIEYCLLKTTFSFPCFNLGGGKPCKREQSGGLGCLHLYQLQHGYSCFTRRQKVRSCPYK